jgi:hypothetical protein
MKNKYKRKAWYFDENVLIKGYADKYGFHPNDGIQCGFDTQKFLKKEIGKVIFYNLNEALEKYNDAKVING